MTAVPTEDLKQVINDYLDCKEYAVMCQKRVGLLEEYRENANKVIAGHEKKAPSIVLPVVISVLTGFAAGYIITR